MKAAMHTAPGVLECREVPEPAPGFGEIKVRVEYAGICGSDVEIVFDRFGLQKLDGWPKGPKIEGHEACGVIAEIGPGVRQPFRVGQRVGLGFRAACGVCYYCRNGLEHFCEYDHEMSGTWAQYALFPEGAVYPLPNDVSLELAALVEPMSIAVHLIDLTETTTGQSLLISGAGTIGLLSLAVALNRGATTVLVSEPNEAKRRIALEMGATAAVDPTVDGGAELAAGTESLTAGRGFQAVLEVSGNSHAAKSVVDLVAKKGTVVWGGVYPDEVEIGVRPFLMYQKELTIKGAYLAPYSFYRAIEVLNKLDLSRIVTAVYPLEEVQVAFDEHLKGNSIKTLLKCW